MQKKFCEICKNEISKKYRHGKRWSNARFCSLQCNGFSKRGDLELRFKSKITIQENGCWGWIGAKTLGYSVISYGRKQLKASRVSWFVYNGFWSTKGVHICHTCDNPECVNPAHLFLGSSLINNLDKIKKGRSPIHSGKKEVLSAEKVKKILKSKSNNAELSKEYGVSEITIYRVKRRMTWKDVCVA